MDSDIFSKLNKVEPESPPRVYFWRRLLVCVLLVVGYIAYRVYDYGFGYLSSKAFLSDRIVYVLPILTALLIAISLGEYLRLKLWQAKRRRQAKAD